jgi:hypothetical protein
MMHGLCKIERHKLGTLGGDLLLTAWGRTETDALEETEHGYDSKNHDRSDGSAVVIFMPKTLMHRHPYAPSPYSSSSGLFHTPGENLPRLTRLVCWAGSEVLAPRTSQKSAILGLPYASGPFYFDSFWSHPPYASQQYRGEVRRDPL